MITAVPPTKLELRHFRYFICLAEELHFGRAAKRLNIVQPALTAQIKGMEQMLGVDLFERSKRRVELSEAGRQFLRESYATLAQAKIAVETVTGYAEGATGTLRIGFGANAAITGLLSNSIRRFRLDWPRVNVVIKEMASNQVPEALGRNEIDIGFAAKTDIEPLWISSKTVGKWPWLLAICETHPLSRSERISLPQVAQESLAVYAEADGRANISGILAVIDSLSWRSVYKTNHITSIMAYVASGLGIAFVPSPIKTLNFPGIVYLEVEDSVPDLEMTLLWKRDTSDMRVSHYLDCVKPHQI